MFCFTNSLGFALHLEKIDSASITHCFKSICWHRMDSIRPNPVDLSTCVFVYLMCMKICLHLTNGLCRWCRRTSTGTRNTATSSWSSVSCCARGCATLLRTCRCGTTAYRHPGTPKKSPSSSPATWTLSTTRACWSSFLKAKSAICTRISSMRGFIWHIPYSICDICDIWRLTFGVCDIWPWPIYLEIVLI